MNGVICIDKPKGISSFRVVSMIRGMTKQRHVGHGGTLDPIAGGVLPVFIGTATKAVDMLPNQVKRYIAAFKMGVSTDTLDITGKVLKTCESSYKAEDIRIALSKFKGNISQVPPMYSAVFKDGRRLYDIARSGITVERIPRTVTVNSIKLLNFDEDEQIGIIDIVCGKGTYIRSLCSDMGDLLGVGAVMIDLTRTASGIFLIENSITLEKAQSLSDSGELAEKLIPVDSLFDHLPFIKLDDIQSYKFLNGVRLDLRRIKRHTDGICQRIYGNDGKFLGVASLDLENQELIIEKVFAERY